MAAHGGRRSGPQLSTQTLDAQVTSSGLKTRCYVLLFRVKTFERRQPWTLKDGKTGRKYLVVGPAVWTVKLHVRRGRAAADLGKG